MLKNSSYLCMRNDVRKMYLRKITPKEYDKPKRETHRTAHVAP